MSDELLDLLTVAQVSEQLKVNPETVRRWLRSGRLKGKLLGDRAGWRIPRAEVNRLLIGDVRATSENPGEWHRPQDELGEADPKRAA